MWWLYEPSEIFGILAAAILIDLWVGDPARFPHPVVQIGKWISFLEKKWRLPLADDPSPEAAKALKRRGVWLVLATIALSFITIQILVMMAAWIHPWAGYAVSAWFISTTIAIKGLKEAAYRVTRPLEHGNLEEARTYTGYIVGRDTSRLKEDELTRAVVETVTENSVDAVISPLFYALLGGAPLAMVYRASNTLDSMVGYKNKKYLLFGWASARWDDILNWIPARITGFLLIVTAALFPGLSGKRAMRSVWTFARFHPSPNSGIPESAVAGALGIELGGRNVYGGQANERARMGWPLRERTRSDISQTVKLLYGISFLVLGGILLTWVLVF